MLKIMKGETPPPPSQADPALAEVVMKCIAFKPEDRWQSARELADALEACAAGKYYPQREPELERMAIIYGPPRDYGTPKKAPLRDRLPRFLGGKKRRP